MSSPGEYSLVLTLPQTGQIDMIPPGLGAFETGQRDLWGRVSIGESGLLKKTEVSGGTGLTLSWMPSEHTHSLWPVTPSGGADFGLMGLGPGSMLWERPQSTLLGPWPTPLPSLACGLNFLFFLRSLHL